MPPGLYQYSVVISTAQREMKITAPTKERHDIWLNVGYLCVGSAHDSFLIRIFRLSSISWLVPTQLQ